jgi:hypothetical protein
MALVESVAIVDSGTGQDAWDSPFQGRPLDLSSWAGPNYLLFDLSCCHQTYMIILCRSEKIEPPESLVDIVQYCDDIRNDLMEFYDVDVEAVKALLNRSTYGIDSAAWKLQFFVENEDDHPFIQQFFRDMAEVCGKLRSPHHFDVHGEPLDHRRHNEPLTVRTHYIQSQLLRCMKERLIDRWGFDADMAIVLFDAVFVAKPEASKGAEKYYIEILNDLVDLVEEEFNCYISVAIKVPGGKGISSTREFYLQDGSLESLVTNVPSGSKTFIDIDLMACHFTALVILCQWEGKTPPPTLLECIARRETLRKELAAFYGCNSFVVKALLNRLVDGGTVESWRLDFGVVQESDDHHDHPFITKFQEELNDLAGRRYATLGMEYPCRSWIASLVYIQQQIIAMVLGRLESEHEFDVSDEHRVDLFDGFALKDATGIDMRKRYSNFASQRILDDVVGHLWEESNIWVGLSMKFTGKTIPSRIDFVLADGPPRGIIVRPPKCMPREEKNEPKVKKRRRKRRDRGSQLQEQAPGIVKLQAQVRGFLVREDLMAEIKEHEASRIQAAVRGVLTRKQFSMAYLEEFLSRIDLHRYLPALESFEIRSLLSLRQPEVTDAFLNEIGMKKFHVLKLRAAVAAEGGAGTGPVSLVGGQVRLRLQEGARSLEL